jgi:DNA-binding transcriptional ArsR family regulator
MTPRTGRADGGARTAPPPVHRVKAELFRILGHPIRVRILELLRDGERTVGDLQSALSLDSGGTSQHLGVLRRHGVLDTRRAGTKIYYRVKDPRTFQLLEVAREILMTSLAESRELLDELTGSADRAPTRTPRRASRAS